jgi:hypothetical protein
MIDYALLIAALIVVESGGDVNAVGDNGKAVGCLQIHPITVRDCNRILGLRRPLTPESFRFKEDDRLFESTSRAMCIMYLRHYGKAYERKTGEPASYEVLARIWNGGPKGYTKPATDSYWRKVRAELDKHRSNKLLQGKEIGDDEH